MERVSDNLRSSPNMVTCASHNQRVSIRTWSSLVCLRLLVLSCLFVSPVTAYAFSNPFKGRRRWSATHSQSTITTTTTTLRPVHSEPVFEFALPEHQQSQTKRIVISPTTTSSSTDIITPAATVAAVSFGRLSQVEVWLLQKMDVWYRKALSMKCPFMRRRASDLLDAADMVVRFVVIRHKSLDLMGPPPGWRCEGATCLKLRHLPIQQVADIVKQDWNPVGKYRPNKGYYITGKLNTTIYRDDCIFDGPDPDMPVRGLRKYLTAASQLFDQGKSESELLEMIVVDDHTLQAKWRMNGVLRLPWKPKLPNWTGTTTYHRDADGLIYRHEETWDMSVLQAFLRTFWPDMARRIWKRNDASLEDYDDDDQICTVE